jgi:arginyl-tRNA synthetase
MNELADKLTELLRRACRERGWPVPDPRRVVWQPPRGVHAGQADLATPSAMAYAREHGKPVDEVVSVFAGAIEASGLVEHVHRAGPGFINVVQRREEHGEQLRRILAAADAYGAGDAEAGRSYRLEFVSANPTGPLVIVNARAAAVGDALARILRAQGARVETQYYVNDAGNQFVALARSLEARLAEALGRPGAAVPEDGYPGEYLADLARGWIARDRAAVEAALALAPEARVERIGREAVRVLVEQQRRVLADYGTCFDRWSHEAGDVRAAGLPERALSELAARGHTYVQDGALWFRSTAFGDDKDRVLRKSDGELTYFAVDIGFHHYGKFADVDRVIDFLGPDHHGYVPRLRAAMQALGHEPERFDVLIVQLVTLLRDGQPVRMSKRRGEYVLMEELLEEVGRDAARFTFLTRRHDSPLEFDLAVATRQSADNPVYYVQYAHARVQSLFRTAAEQGLGRPSWTEVDFGRLALPEEQALIKRLGQFPGVVAAAARAREPHRVAYYLGELAGLFHPYYKAHRVIGEDRALTWARLGLSAAVGQVVRRGLGLLGVSAPDSM